MKNKIRFLATGDIHSNKKLLDNISIYNDFNNIDYILFIGDLSDKKNDFNQIINTFKNKPILMVQGNHETKKQLKVLENKYNIFMLNKDSKQIHSDLILFGPEFINLGFNSKNEEQIFNQLENRFQQIKNIKCKLFLSHMPPEETKIAMATPYYPYIGGSFAVKEFLENKKIDLTLVGHIHESSGLEEIVNNNKILNVGKTSKIIEFDTNTKELKILN